MVRALIAAFVLSVVLAGSTAAQQPATGIQATGTGTASAPAQTAHLQFLLGSGVSSFEVAPMEITPGTPSAAMSDTSFGMGTLTETQLDPVVAAIAATGVAGDAIVVSLPVNNIMFGPVGP
jgi:hypothetical protein